MVKKIQCARTSGSGLFRRNSGCAWALPPSGANVIFAPLARFEASTPQDGVRQVPRHGLHPLRPVAATAASTALPSSPCRSRSSAGRRRSGFPAPCRRPCSRRHHAAIGLARSLPRAASCTSTKATGTWPRSASSRPITPEPTIAGCWPSMASISAGKTLMPLDLQHFLAAAEEMDESLRVDQADVAGMQPAVAQALLGRFRLVPVALEVGRGAHAEFALLAERLQRARLEVADLEFRAGHRQADEDRLRLQVARRRPAGRW